MKTFLNLNGRDKKLIRISQISTMEVKKDDNAIFFHMISGKNFKIYFHDHNEAVSTLTEITDFL